MNYCGCKHDDECTYWYLVGAACRDEDALSRVLLKVPWLHPVLFLQLPQVPTVQEEFLQQHIIVHQQLYISKQQTGKAIHCTGMPTSQRMPIC